jgi:hypothetical protein
MRWWRVTALGIAASGCGGSDVASLPDDPLTSLQVITTVEGEPHDPDGYTLSIDGGPGLPLSVDDFLLVPNIKPGEHMLELSGVAPECRIRGENPRTVQALANQTTRTEYGLSCGIPGTGRITVSTFTYGTGPESYVVQVTGGPSATIGPEDQVTLLSVRAGFDTVTLRGVPSVCRVTQLNPRVLQVLAGAVKLTLFKIRCPEEQ